MSIELNSSSQETARNFIQSLSDEQKIFLYGIINLNQRDLVINWDLDQTLAISEDPVKAAVDAKYGKNYSSRRTDGWDSITKWLVSDGIDEKIAKEDEKLFWRNNEILMKAEPNEYLRWLSYAAYVRKIPQYITTVRSPGLRQMTYKWVEKHFSWIPPGKINFRVAMNVNGDAFKVGTILDLYSKNPGLIHVDDDLTIIKPLINAAPKLGLIGIKYPSDDVSGLNHSGNRVFVERDILGSLIPYRPFAVDMVAQCH